MGKDKGMVMAMTMDNRIGTESRAIESCIYAACNQILEDTENRLVVRTQFNPPKFGYYSGCIYSLPNWQLLSFICLNTPVETACH